MIDLENQEREIINIMLSQRPLRVPDSKLSLLAKRERFSSNIKSKMAEIYGCPPELLICPSWMTAEHK